MAAHSYWRCWFGTKNGSNFNYQALWALDFQDASGTSLCVGGTAFASTSYGGNTPDHVFGPTPSGWISNNELACSIGYHFPAPVDPAKIAFAPWNAGNYPVLTKVEWSDDGVTWTTQYLITQPTSWINQHVYTMDVGTGAAVAQYWLMLETAIQSGGDPSSGTVAEMRFLDNNGTPFTGFTDMRGTFDVNSNSYSWALAWNNAPADNIYSGGDHSVYCQVMYPSPVQVSGLYIQAVPDGFYFQYTPAAGGIWSSADGMMWGKVWDFGPDNATGLPIAVNGTVSYAAPVVPVADFARRFVLLA